MPRTKRHREPGIRCTSYQVRITGWDWDYSFNLNAPPWDDKQFADYRHLTVHGDLLRPRRIKVKATELFFLPEAVEMERSRDQPPPRCVGTLNIQHQRLIGYLTLPLDALGLIMQMLTADRFKYVLLDGEAVRYRKAFIRCYRFAESYNEADYPKDV